VRGKFPLLPVGKALTVATAPDHPLNQKESERPRGPGGGFKPDGAFQIL